MELTDYLISIFTGLLFLSTTGLWLTARKQSKDMKASIEEARKSAKAMEVVAKNTGKSVKAVEDNMALFERATTNQMRAYLSVTVGTAVYQDRPNGIRFEGKPVLLNTGQTPAHKVGFKAKAALLPVPLPKDFDFTIDKDFSGAAVLGPQQNFILSATVDDFVEDSEVEKIKSGNKDKTLYVWGIVKYEDIFGKKHTTEFCQILIWLTDGKTVWGCYTQEHNQAS